MRISTPLVEVKDQLINFISEGYSIMGEAFSNPHNANVPTMRRAWEIKVTNYLGSVFPTKKEFGQFLHTPGPELYFNSDSSINNALNRANTNLKVLEHILDTLERYYQFEADSIRLYIEKIDSFSLVRGVNHSQVESYLDNGIFNYDEKAIKQAFAQVIGESFVPNDHGGETEDLYTSRVLLNAQRVQTSII
ncbi:MAG TPA: hypothetical protein VNE38_14665, partial [Ktedonobacteraceae bacterium]|nr:hypothetical protein [Ktedonobacteraceae bacterium]